MRWVVAAALLAACNGTTPSPTPAPAEKHAGSAAVANAAAATAAPTSKGGLVEGAMVRPHHEEPVVECPAKIPDSAEDEARVTGLLDEANKQIEAGAFGAAWTCADRAADL